MTPLRFSDLVTAMEAVEHGLLDTKGSDYTQGGSDRLLNFKTAGKELGIKAEQVLWIYLKKHMDAILTYIVDGEIKSESIEGRITDARNYLALLRGLIEDGKAEPCTLPTEKWPKSKDVNLSWPGSK